MFFFRAVLCALAAVTSTVHAAGVVGRPQGFAKDTTGGGDLAPISPADINELKEWLTDAEPRVILLEKEYNFIGSEGICKDCDCCIPNSNTCGSSGQNAIDVINWCKDAPKIKCTYNNETRIDVASNKTLIGLEDKGVLRGVGLRFTSGASNIIVQNVHITELNPEYIWGGDALSMTDCDNIWIDHVKISLVGRQMISMGFESSGRVTISNTEFDGRTSWSASCDGHHYWTILGMGTKDHVSFYGNWIHHTSGRGPDLGKDSVWHLFNNYWSDVSGHALSVFPEPSVFVEGNVFESVKYPNYRTGCTGMFTVNETTAQTCETTLGRQCMENQVSSDSGPLTLQTADNTTTLEIYKKIVDFELEITSPDKVKDSVMANAGIGKLSGGTPAGNGGNYAHSSGSATTAKSTATSKTVSSTAADSYGTPTPVPSAKPVAPESYKKAQASGPSSSSKSGQPSSLPKTGCGSKSRRLRSV
ncbi:putative pectin lyase F [Ceratocystis lukuohia]|uniref:pectin lyase n=1 Tax=Ceratocystis lukuohia TaxID=2019550 RepID=A0ABR4MQS1_9PEZI